MRVLLLNPSIRAEQFGRFAALLEPMPCIGITYVATFLAQAGHQVRVWDDFAMQAGPEAILAEVDRFRPDVFGASILTPVATDVKNLLRRARAKHPGMRTFAGNIHADVFPDEFLDDGTCDAVVHGEGEKAAVDLLEAWARGEDGSKVPGVSVKGHRGKRRPIDANLDAYPFPDWGLTPYTRYSLLPLGTIQRPIVALAASRGCPYSCTYCSLESKGKGYRRRSVGNVVDEMEHDVRAFGAKQIGFMDPIFPLGSKHAIEFSKEVVRRGLEQKMSWLSELRTDSVDRDALVWMHKSGCRRLVFGIESGDDALLKTVKKKNDIETSRQTVKWCREIGITTVGLFMIGMPGETPEQTKRTIDYACELELDFAKFAITVPFPGSDLYEQMVRDGKLSRRDWENYTTFNPDLNRIVVASDVQTPEQLLNSLREATMRFYLRPRMIAHQLFKVRSVDAMQMARGLWSVMPDIPRRARSVA
ncbi:MAG: B12-binding domain-containing radical SAM protein [Myxococcota bacterium]